MSDQGSGYPPQDPPGTPEGAWEPVNPPESALPPPPPEAALPPPEPPAPEPPPPEPPPQSPPPPPGYPPPPPQGQYPPPGYPPPGQPPYPPAQPLSPNTAATIAYLTFIPAIVLLLMEPYRRDSYVRFHAWQCILLTGVGVAGGIIFGFLGGIGHVINMLLHLILFIFWLIAIIKANKGERYHIPIVGDLAENVARTV